MISFVSAHIVFSPTMLCYNTDGYMANKLLKRQFAIILSLRQMPNGKVDYCYTQYEPENVAVKKMYESLGFVETGEIDDGELVMRLKLC